MTAGAGDYFDSFISMGTKEAKAGRTGAGNTIFRTYSGGVSTQLDNVVYDFDTQRLSNRIVQLIDDYNAEVSRWNRAGKPSNVDDFVGYDKIKWNHFLKNALRSGVQGNFDTSKIRLASYRPFVRKPLYFDDLLVDAQALATRLFQTVESEAENYAISLTNAGSEKPFFVFLTKAITDYHLVGAGSGTQCFPFYTYDEDGSNRRENITDWALAQFQSQYGASVTKWDIFYGIYGLLHSPEYRTKYAHNLKRDLPRIPFVGVESWNMFVEAGRKLAQLHVEYEQVAPFKLKHIENRDVPWSWRVGAPWAKMRLNADKTSLAVNEALTLGGIPEQVFGYRLGNRSALEWVIDQYQVKTDKRSGITSDPNNPDDPEYIVRLVKQVITVSVETVNIVAALPSFETQVDAAP